LQNRADYAEKKGSTLGSPAQETNARRQRLFTPDFAFFPCVTQSSAAKKLLVRSEKSSVCGAARKSPPEASDGLFSLFSYAVLPLQIVSFFMRVILTNL